MAMAYLAATKSVGNGITSVESGVTAAGAAGHEMAGAVQTEMVTLRAAVEEVVGEGIKAVSSTVTSTVGVIGEGLAAVEEAVEGQARSCPHTAHSAHIPHRLLGAVPTPHIPHRLLR